MLGCQLWMTILLYVSAGLSSVILNTIIRDGNRCADALARLGSEKKKHRKEMIAVKRRERMLRRGVDLEQINMVK
ncbi:hypothetical protein V6N12_064236 [Hibiscus sabdariffa]|uniref:Uncharacterized protein n=1 Tax=Hibiscus sabdariffa TaxID=183260 RepID=A0ABR2G592_9ROSI